jgi:hypothetical protein
MEAVRPNVDAYVLDLLRTRTFKKNHFFETREGICRLMPPLTHELAETGTLWAGELGHVTERVARTLFEAVRSSISATPSGKPGSPLPFALPTPLTERNRSRGRESYRRKPEPKTVRQMQAWLLR